jgi:D-3-phosphoglycerate dehydrogenase / 2-oxoglutarate reductase
VKVFLLDSFHPAGIEYASKHAEIVRWDDPRVRNWPEEADALMVRGTKIREADLARAKKLKIISKQGVGYDNIDVAAAKKHGIPVVRTPGVNKEAVAELAIGLAIAVGRRIAELDRRVRSQEKLDRTKILGVEMWGKTVGIVGVGNIGSRVAHKWQAAFECKVVGYDPHKKLAIPQVSLDELLGQADLVTVHVPLNEETKYLIGKRELALMKPTAILINTTRGPVVDQAALAAALKEGKIAAAGLDVFEKEPVPLDDPILALPNVVALPHIGSASVATRGRMAKMAADNLLAALSGRRPPNLVNPEAWSGR